MRRKLQIFVSSTFTDLVHERQAAVSAILKAGHIPAGMELFTAGDKSQMDTIKRWIDESDVYMLILGGRYGSIEPTSGVSYTELEYDYASEQNKPLFAVVIDDQALNEKVRSEGTSIIELENQQQLKQFREKVLSKISSFFKSDSDIKLCVHESLADFRENPDLKGWISGANFEDPKPLHDEISELRTQLAKMKSEAIVPPPNSSPEKTESKIDFNYIIRILYETKVNIPDNLGGPVEQDLLWLFDSNQEALINGVTNSASGSEAESFLYHNMAPKLMLHGLMANEKVPSVRYRRSFVTAKGIAVLAEIEKRRKAKLPKKKSDSGTVASDTAIAELSDNKV